MGFGMAPGTHTFTTYTSDDRFGIEYVHDPPVGARTGWRVEFSDPVAFTTDLLENIAQREASGTVVVRQGSPPLPDYLFPTEYLEKVVE